MSCVIYEKKNAKKTYGEKKRHITEEPFMCGDGKKTLWIRLIITNKRFFPYPFSFLPFFLSALGSKSFFFHSFSRVIFISIFVSASKFRSFFLLRSPFASIRKGLQWENRFSLSLVYYLKLWHLKKTNIRRHLFNFPVFPLKTWFLNYRNRSKYRKTGKKKVTIETLR